MASNAEDGFTLPELLLILALASLLALTLGATDPKLSEQRMAALTVAKTGDLLNAAYAEYERFAQTWPNGCDLPTMIPKQNGEFLNGFGEAFHVTCDADNHYLIYQLVPGPWVDFIQQHVERTGSLTESHAQDSFVADYYDDIAGLYGAGLVMLRTELDVTGNTQLNFVRKQFESQHFSASARRDPVQGETLAEIKKPDCPGDKTPAISYSVKGACSLYPVHVQPVDLADVDAVTEADPSFAYTTFGYRFPLSNVSESDGDYWVIAAESYERWYVELPPDADDDDSDPEPTYEKQQGWVSVQEVCRNHSVFDDKNAETYQDFFSDGNGALLYVDAWVGCR